MHELGIAQSVIEIAEAEVARRAGSRLLRVVLRVGELAAVDPDSLQFCFGALVAETPMAGATLAVEYCRRQVNCAGCGYQAASTEVPAVCPACGAAGVAASGGEELEVSFLELEEV